MSRTVFRAFVTLLPALFAVTQVCLAQKPAGPTGSLRSGSRVSARGDRDSPEDIRQREDWFYHQRASPMKNVPAGARLNALKQFSGMSVQKDAAGVPAWAAIGPQPTNGPFPYFPTSGRVTALAVDPSDPGDNTVYLGSAEGGVWKTTDGGQNWSPLTDAEASLAVGSIAIDPTNPSTIYVGTGEENFNFDAYYGAGILKSTNGGGSWTQYPGPFAGASGSDSFSGGAYIGALAVDPANSSILLAAVEGGPSGSGVYRSSNSGVTWTNVQPGVAATEVIFDPVNHGVAYAALGDVLGDASGNGVFKSTDSGQTWSADNGTGLATLPVGSAGRIELAIAPGDPLVLYASVGASYLQGGYLLGLYSTSDGGLNWYLTNAPDYCNPQCWYDDAVRVDPVNPQVIWAGGSASEVDGLFYVGQLLQSLDGGNTWQDISQGANGADLHPDIHAVAFSADGSRVYVGNDGGVWSTSNVAANLVSWNNLNTSLAITQFYSGMSIDPSASGLAFGGTQDNGTQQYGSNVAWQDPGPCGDGSWTAIDPSTFPDTVYAACAGSVDIWKSTLGGGLGTWFSATFGIDPFDLLNFVPPLVIDAFNPLTLYYGTYQVYQSVDGANTWMPMLNSGTSGTLTAIAVAPSGSGTVYEGSDGGQVAITRNANLGLGSTWNTVTPFSLNRYVTQIAVAPNSANTAYVTYSGFSGFTDTDGHVFETLNGGNTWSDISGNLPNIPVNDIAVDPELPGTLYVATDLGVFSTSNGGTSWAIAGTGLPNVAVLSLKLHEVSRTLRAASHGRSAWDLSLGSSGKYPLALNETGQGTVTSTDGMISCVSGAGACTAVYLPGTSVTLNASAGSNASFGGWSGACSGTGSCTLVMNGSQNVRAGFTAAQVTLTVGNVGQGTITSLDGAINCTAAYCSATYPVGTTVTIDALAASGWLFNGWVGACNSVVDPCSIVMTSDLSVVSYFNLYQPQYTLSISESGQGSVTSTDALINCTNGSGTCANSYAGGAIVTLNATPATGWTFSGWGGVCGGGGSCVVVMDTGISIPATFAAPPALPPVPLIEAPLGPGAAVPGHAAFTLTVNGAGFTSTSVVNWNASARATTFVSSRQLQASILSSDVATQGTASVTVSNTAPGAASSNSQPFFVTTSIPAVVFNSATRGTDVGPMAVATGDFNRDGRADLAVVTNSSTLEIFLGNGGGTFTVKEDLTTDFEPVAVVTGDFNNDGNLDLAVATFYTVSIFLGNGDGTFRAGLDTDLYPLQPVSLAVGDFNGDGYLDLAAGDYSLGRIDALLGTGNGYFQAPIEVGNVTYPLSLVSSDFNGDGKLDLASADSESGAVSVFLGAGDGNFGAGTQYAAGGSPRALVTADFNGDGIPDLAAATNNPSGVSVLLGKAGGSLSAPVTYSAGDLPYALVTEDFNGDGVPDLALADAAANTVILFLGDGHGSFGAPASFATGAEPLSVSAADFNLDGRADLVTANFTGGDLSILTGTPFNLALVPGSLAQIQVSANGAIWGINSLQQVLYFNTQTKAWVTVPGSLSQISVGADGSVWGINASHAVYRYAAATNTWGLMPGQMAQIAVGFTDNVWGVNPAGQIYRYDPSIQNWDLMPGLASRVTVGPDGSVWAISSSNSVFHFNVRKQNWDTIAGAQLTQIAVGYGGVVWGLNAHTSQIYQFSTATQSFVLVPGTFTQVSVGTDGTVWAVNNGNANAYHYNPGLPATYPWDVVPASAPLAQISAGYAGAVWAVSSSGSVFEVLPAYTVPAKALRQVAGGLTKLAVAADGAVWGLNSTGNIYAFNLATQNWDLVAGGLSQIAVGFGGAVWGLNSKQQIYNFNAQTQSWNLIPGLLTQIAVGAANAVWGINSSGQVFQYSNQNWYLRAGLTALGIQVAGDGTVWGLNAQQQVYSYSSQTQSWQQVSGLLKQIAVGSATSIWGINSSEDVYSYNTGTKAWSLIPGQLKLLGMGLDGVAWGFNNTGTVYEYGAATGSWNPIGGGTLATITVAADEVVWGLNGTQIYRAH